MRSERGALSRWLVGHLPVTMTIAATGGVMVCMVEHASGGHAQARSPAHLPRYQVGQLTVIGATAGKV